LYFKLFTWQIVNVSGSVIGWILPTEIAPEENAIANGTESSCHAIWETGTINVHMKKIFIEKCIQYILILTLLYEMNIMIPIFYNISKYKFIYFICVSSILCTTNTKY